ncbi:MAG: metallophosphoesterase [Chloroflexi bacterium]|nr:metallophosphoesterase [Chloroflexota bacterium]
MTTAKTPIKVLLVVFLSALFALGAVTFFGASSYEIDGVLINLAARPALTGKTVLGVPPFGEVSAETHSSPLLISATLERVYPDKLEKVTQEAPPGDKLVSRIEKDATHTLKDFVIRLIAIAAVGGLIGALVAQKRVRYGLLGALVGAVVVAGLLGVAYETYNINSFRQPSYSGVLSAAPWMTGALADRLAALKTFREQVKDIAGNVHEFYNKVDSWGPLEASDGDLTVLHVSDLHTNPSGLDLIERIAGDYKPAFIIDTGDATDFGTPLEVGFLNRIATLGRPYLFVPGNHDSQTSIALLRGLPNVSILDGRQKTIDGISVLGVADPASGRSGDTFNSTRPELEAKAKMFQSLVEKDKPLIAAAHNPVVAEAAFRRVPTVLTGHTHRPQVVIDKGWVFINAGTTGAAGLRTFREDKGLPYSLQILHYKRNPMHLVAIDTVTVYGLEREFHLERRLVDGAKNSAPSTKPL